MLVTSISLGIFAGLFEYAGKDAKIFSEHIVVFVILIIIPISFFFKSLYNSFQVIKARTPLTESTAKNYCKLENNLSCLLDSYNKLIKYHKTSIIKKIGRRDDDLLKHLHKSTKWFIWGLVSAVTIAFIMLVFLTLEHIEIIIRVINSNLLNLISFSKFYELCDIFYNFSYQIIQHFK